ncbi:GNAT family N-acetyltransferase [Bacteriovoracaceae bacterium]|nr:GNAT family N-acetyltransferase [Bacteriovoracaceae bacterium]
MNWFLRTKRMNFRELSLKDEDLIYDLDSDPEVMKYITLGVTSTREDIQIALKKTEELFQKHEGRFGYWAVIDSYTSEFMGWFHFRPSKSDPDNIQRIELGYRFKKKFWGQGFATEGSMAFIEYGFKNLKVSEIYAIALKDHTSSMRVMEKVGLKFVREFISPDFAGTTYLDVEYAIKRDDWLKVMKSNE